MQLFVFSQVANAKTKRKSDDGGFEVSMHAKVNLLYAQDTSGVFYPVPGKKKVEDQARGCGKVLGSSPRDCEGRTAQGLRSHEHNSN